MLVRFGSSRRIEWTGGREGQSRSRILKPACCAALRYYNAASSWPKRDERKCLRERTNQVLHGLSKGACLCLLFAKAAQGSRVSCCKAKNSRVAHRKQCEDHVTHDYECLTSS